ncbi:MAG: glycosyltransferase family 2 protein [Planctomycetes bacterium]|uniref:glycosyltransferase n=1 Tax=Candidatus Wunengus californicus TaxID=3367619 RepID=UPI0040272BD2|nr:glycosyltransferase family 2 protein [Planctomycetota bacterium]
MKFSILVPAYNEEQSISSCLNSLISVVYDDKEIIVIDDASTDRTIQAVEKFLDKGVILVMREKNGGRAAALNSGLQRATGDVIITTDADTVTPSDWLQRFKSCFEQQDVVAVGGAYQACNKDKPLVNATSILDQILNGVFKKSLVPNKLSGVNSAIIRKALLDLGGFNENSWWSEDSELGWKLKRTGKVVYDPDNVVNTTYPDTWSGIWKRKFYWGYAMGLKFREQMPFNIKLWLRPLIFMALFISLLTFLATIPFGINVFLVPGVIFLILLNSLTIMYIPLGAIVMVRNKDCMSLKTLSQMAVLPIVREFAYVYGMFLGFCNGRVGSIRPSWKEK